MLLLSWLWQLNHQLGVNDAKLSSEKFIMAAADARLPLTSLVLDDRQHFENAIAAADKVLQQGHWTAGDDRDPPDRTKLLDPVQRRRERQAAGELHFWTAAGYLRSIDLTNDPEQRSQLLAQADTYNRFAGKILGDGEFSGVAIQASKIAALQKGEAFEFEPDWSVLENASRSDRVMYSFLGRRDYANALKQLNHLVEEDPLDFLAWMQMGQTYYATGKQELAQACFTLCIALDPQNSYPRLYRAMSILKADAGNYQQAIDDLLEANRLSPNTVAVIQNLGLAYGKVQNLAKAKEFFDEAIRLGTTETRTWYLRSRLNRLLGNEQQAAQDMKYFLETEPTDPVSWRTRGTQKISTSPADAVYDLNQALAMHDSDIVALNNLAHVYSERLDDLPKAIEAMNRIVEIAPQEVRHRATRGVLLARNGQREDALADAQQCLQQDRTADTLYRVAGIFAQNSKSEPEDQEIAMKLLRQALARNPELVAKMMSNDPDLKPLKGNPELQEITALLDKLAAMKKK